RPKTPTESRSRSGRSRFHWAMIASTGSATPDHGRGPGGPAPLVPARTVRRHAAVTEAGPSRPVQVLGLTSVPGAGDTFMVVPEDRMARQIADQRQARERFAELAKSRGRLTLEDVLERIKQGEVNQLNLILKGDVSGSVEALEDALLNIDVGAEDEVGLRIIGRGVGAITENDINLAKASDA